MMKKIFLFMAIAFAAISCEQFDQVKGTGMVENISMGVEIKLKKDDNVPAPANYKVKLNNYAENIEVIKTVEAGDVITIDGIIPGIYTVAISGESQANGFTYVFNGNLSNIDLLENNTINTLEMEAAKSGNILFKELYYAGSKVGGKTSYFRDQYYELYNNSNTVQYLDGLCIGNLYPTSTTTLVYVWDRPDYQDYVYLQTIWQVPGKPGVDKKYPLQPGESVIIAQMADNHQREALNPDSPVNLRGAEFETYLKTTANTTDNENSINMYMAFWATKSASQAQWMVTINGGAYVIFYPDGEIDPNTHVIAPQNKANKAKDIPISWIVDAVECMLNETKISQKRMPAVLDAGATWVSGTYNAKSVSRKIKETTADGRVIYQDTNNSLEDFQVNDTPILRRDGAGIPSWNTWAN